MAWLVYVRPDICAQVAKLAQITESQFILNPIECFLSLGKRRNSLKAWKYRLYHSKLDLDTLFIRVYADASFGTNRDGSSQLGYCIVLTDTTGRFSPVKYRSGKCYRVTHSAMAAETCALAEAFDAAFVVKHSLEQLLGKKIALQMLTDSKHLFDSISHSTQTKERRIMIDIAASKQSFERAEISDLGLVATEDMLADCFTEVRDPKQLRNAMDSGFLLHDIKQWIVRNI
jgi:ribonuclease HI